jgi:ribosomal protein S18 acetylase RimI-like enzyme
LTQSVIIRNFNFSQDYATVYQLWKDAGPGIHLRRSDDPEEIKKKLARDPDLFLIAEFDGNIVGSVIGGFDGRRGFVYHLAVAETYRHLGIGTQLMSELEQRLKAKGCIKAYLFIARDNPDVIRYYESHGWAPMDVFPYGKDLA